MKLKQSLSLLVLSTIMAYAQTATAVTINGAPLRDILQPGDSSVVFKVTLGDGIQGAYFSCKNGQVSNVKFLCRSATVFFAGFRFSLSS